MSNRRCPVSAVLAFVLLALAIASASITGSISGVVTDKSGAVISGATVVATDTQTGIQTTQKTDAKGFFNLPTLAVGTYNLEITHVGFKTFRQTGLVIDANSALRADASLDVGSINEKIEVSTEAAMVDTQTTQMGEVIEGTKMTSVPLNGRSFIDLLSLQPGVSPYKNTDTTTSGIGADPTTVSGDQTNGTQSVNGGRLGSNGFMVNGADAQEGVHNGAAIIPNLDSIYEFRIITNNFDAEYGNFSGEQINVVTKSGTNRFHGSVFDFLRNTDFDAANYFDQGARGDFKQNQFGGTIGGPIKKDRAFFSRLCIRRSRPKEPKMTNSRDKGSKKRAGQNIRPKKITNAELARRVGEFCQLVHQQNKALIAQLQQQRLELLARLETGRIQ